LSGSFGGISMPEPLTIGFFLEDSAHEQFFTTLVRRVAEETNTEVVFDVRNATGGKGRVLTELRRYLRDAQAGRVPMHPVLVVAIDGNCATYQVKRTQIEQLKDRSGYPGELVCAVPDPHIERWYLADVEGFQLAIVGSQPPALPAYKCERGRYKQAIGQALRSAGIEAQLDIPGYAAEIVAQMNLHRAGQMDTAFKHFVADLRATLKRHTGGQHPL